MTPLSLDQQLSAIASIAQIVQAVVVIVGIPLVILQVRNLLTERKHRQWEALQWALSLLQQETEDATLIFRERLEADPQTFTHTDESARNLIVHLSGSLTVVQLAIKQKYVDQNLLFTSIGANLARLHMLILENQHEHGLYASLAAALTRFGGMKLLESARVWHDAHTPGPAPSISQVMRFGPDDPARPR
jgi:hypothetical protein